MTLEFIFDEPEIMDKDKGYYCSCCKMFVKRYTRSFNANMALALIVLYRNKDKGFVHLENLMTEKGYKRSGDAAYLRHYRLIEPLKEDREDGSARNGKYKITGAGIMFCEAKTTVQSKFLIFNNQCEGFAGNEITITEALGKRFNYSELMYEATFDSFYTLK